FLFADGELVTWADAEVSQALAQACLPIPSSTWRRGELVLTTTAFATGGAADAAARVRYRVENAGRERRRVRLFAALRPFQVTPGAAQEVQLAGPFGEPLPGAHGIGEWHRSALAADLEATSRAWERKLGKVRIRLGAGASECVDALRTATAHILVNRDGPALQ